MLDCFVKLFDDAKEGAMHHISASGRRIDSLTSG